MMLWLADGPGTDFRKERLWTGCGRTEELNNKIYQLKAPTIRKTNNAHRRSFVRGGESSTKSFKMSEERDADKPEGSKL